MYAAAAATAAAAAAAADDDDDDDNDLSIYVIYTYRKHEYLCELQRPYLLHLSYDTVHANRISDTDTGNTWAIEFLSLIIWWRNCVQNIKTFPEDINWIMWIELGCYGLFIQCIEPPC